MADDSMRGKAAAMFGKEFMNVMKGGQPSGMQQNAAAALQKRANARPIPTYKDGGKISSRVANRAAMAGYKDGGEAKYKAKLDRKMADIEKAYAKAKAKNPDVAKAKYEQRVADAKDDYAKWTKSDRSETSKAEKAAEAALSEARRTKGMSIRARDMAAKGTQVSKSEPSDAPKAPSTIEGPGMKPTMGGMPSRKAVKPAAPKVAKPPRPALVKTGAPKPAAPKVAKPPRPALVKTGAPKPVAASDRAIVNAMGRAPTTLGRPGGIGDTNRIAGAMGRAPAGMTAPKKEPLINLRMTSESEREAKRAARIAAGSKPGATSKEKFYAKYPDALKSGGRPCKLAVGGTGKVRKGMAKGK